MGTARARGARAADAGPARLRLHAPARDHRRRRPGARAARHLRRRARLGALLPDRVRRRAVAGALRGRSRRTACAPAATARSTRCGSRRATACGPPTSPPTRRRSRRGSSSACAPTRSSSAPTRCVEPQRRLRAITLEEPRAVALGNEPVRVGGEIVGRVTSGGYGYTVERSIAYAYLPVDDRRGRRRWRSTSSASGSAEPSPPSRCSTPKEPGSAGDPDRAARRVAPRSPLERDIEERRPGVRAHIAAPAGSSR